jgi:hypothetical protein
MEDRPAARRLAFAVIVVVLAALGAYLLGPAAHRGGISARGGEPARRLQPSARAAVPIAASSSGTPDIYQWLPFTEAGLATAAATVVQFGDAYGSYSYTVNATAYAAPGVAAARQSQQQIAVGTATIDSIRTFGPGSLTFVIEVTQQLTESAGRSQQTFDYAVTVTGDDTSWQVTDVELAAAGNS